MGNGALRLAPNQADNTSSPGEIKDMLPFRCLRAGTMASFRPACAPLGADWREMC